jgi:hypothetical protein
MGLAKTIGKKLAEKATEGALESVAKKAPRMSEALNPHVGKRLYITQADRTALNYPEGLLGGPGYVELAGIDPKYKDIAWAVQSPGVAKTLVGSMARNPEEAVFANLIGSPEQHRSNKVVFDRIMKRFEKAVEEDKLTPELRETINKRLSNIKDPKTGKSFFPEDVDILSPEFNQHAQTFHQRAYIADILAGKGVGGKKGSIIDYPQVIKETTDPLLLEAKTGDIGDRLFSLSGNIQERPELHPAFHYSLSGKKESEAFAPAPQGIVLKNFTKDFTERTGRLPTYYDLTRGYAPSEKITDEMLERMYKEGYAGGGSVEKDPEQIRDMIKNILGSDIEKADGGTITTPEIEVTPNEKLETLKEVPRTGKISGKIADILKPASRFLEKYQIIPEIPLIGGADLADITGVKGVQTLAEDMSYGYKPIRNLERGKLQTSYFDPRMLDAADLAGTAVGVPILAKNLGKTAFKEGLRQIQTGEGMLGRNVMNPRMNIIKDQGGMLVGGEKALDDELISMKKNEALNVDMTGANTLPEMFARREVAPKDPNAVALNAWIDTKVKKYLRNQAGTEADPILKTIESGVEHNFQPAMGDTKYSVRNKRYQIGKPTEGIAKTDLGKEFEYKVDSIFKPTKSAEIKDILQRNEGLPPGNAAEKFKASLLRMEHDLPVYSKEDLDAIKLVDQIPDEYVYSLSGTNITNRLGLDHVSDVLMEDLRSGKLRPEQLSQMSIEKAIRRTAEYDAEKAKAMAKANASSVEGMPIPKAYDDGYKWVELKHDTDPKKTQAALKSEGEMMGHCVGGYCPEVESGEIKIYSLRGPDGKSHVTIEARPQFSMTLWRNANLDAINSNPKLKQYDFSMNSLDNDHKYGYRMTEQDYVREMTKEMKKLGINPIEPPSYMELHQVKGKQNKRPDNKYQSYISDFVKNNPTKHEIVSVEELQNTNLMNVQDVIDDGVVGKDLHFHPDVEKIVKNYPKENLMAMYRKGNVSRSPMEVDEDIKYNIFKDAAKDLARQNKSFIDKDDILNHIREKYLTPPKKVEGGSINLQQEYKLENMRRRYG